MLPSRTEIARSIELYVATQELQNGEERLVLTHEPLLRKKEEVQQVVVAFGSYDPLTCAHEALFMQALSAARENGKQESGKKKSLDELLVISPTTHFDKIPDLGKNAVLYDRVHALEVFAGCFGNVSIGIFNRAYFADLISHVRTAYPDAKVHVVLGVDVLAKIVDPEGYARKDLDPEDMVTRSAKATYIVSERNVDGKKVTVDDLRQKYPTLAGFQIIPLALPGLESVSSTEIRHRRNTGLPTEHLEATGMSEFIQRREMYCSNGKYAAFVSVRERFAEENRRKPVAAYIEKLMEELERTMHP